MTETSEAYANEFLGPDYLGALMRVDVHAAQPAVERLAKIMGEVLPIEAGGWRLALVEPPVHAGTTGVEARLEIARIASGERNVSDVRIVPAWALDDLDRAEAAIRAQAAVLAEIFAYAPAKIDGLMPFELFDVSELLAVRRSKVASELEAQRRKLWHRMLPPARRGTTRQSSKK